MTELEAANSLLKEFQSIVNTGKARTSGSVGKLKVGVDLGTSSIVLAVLNEENQPIYGSFEYATAIRDGLVVNYVETVRVLERLKVGAEEALGQKLGIACGAVPPGTVGKNKEIVKNVIESAGLEAGEIFDEPTAAARLLSIENGVVVDVGGGTTGISILQNGQIISVSDEPTGGTHMNLVLAGYYNISPAKAEELKRDKQKEREIFSLIRPVAEKMASITLRALESAPVQEEGPIYIVGGASNFSEFEQVFRQYTHRKVNKPIYPEFVTPLGIAMGCGEDGV